MYYLIYKTTNLINNKIYIGKHKTKDKNDAYLGSGTILQKAVQKYGSENFKKEILFECSSEQEMNLLEEDIVDLEFISRLDTYNVTLGGFGGFYHVNSKKLNIYEGHKEQAKINLAGGTAGFQKKLKDKKFHEEWRQKVSNSAMFYFLNGGKNGFEGAIHTSETRKKIGQKSAVHQKGSGNSQFGTMWICNVETKQNKKISRNSDIPIGWIKGRNRWPKS